MKMMGKVSSANLLGVAFMMMMTLMKMTTTTMMMMNMMWTKRRRKRTEGNGNPLSFRSNFQVHVLVEHQVVIIKKLFFGNTSLSKCIRSFRFNVCMVLNVCFFLL